MAKQNSLPPPDYNQNHTNKPISSFLGSPRFFSGILARSISDSETVISPNSILDCKQTFNLGSPFGYDRKSSIPITPTGKRLSNNKILESESIGLALVDSKETSSGSSSKDYNSMVLFGAKLKVEIPSSVESLAEVKNSTTTREEFAERLNYTEMESSEDYTCVISHGPNPKTTHIFDNCIVESCCGVRKLGELIRNNGSCRSCKVDLPEVKDIYMYRGERVVYNHECCCQEMNLESQEQGSGTV